MKYKAFDPHEFVSKETLLGEGPFESRVVYVSIANKLADEIKKLREALYGLSQENKTLKDGLEKLKKNIDGIIVFVKDGKE